MQKAKIQIKNVKIKVDGKEICSIANYQFPIPNQKYERMVEVELEEGEHNIKLKMEEQKIKLVLVNKQERQNLEKEIWQRINQSESELCYIFEDKEREFYVP